MKSKRVLPPVYFIITIVIMVALHFIFPVAKFIVFPYNILGAIPLFSGMVILIAAFRAFKKHKTTIKPFEESTTLVTNSVFRITRNPIYLSLVLILAGIATLVGSLTPYVAIPVFVILIQTIFIRTEEEILEEKFDKDWLEYKRKVRRWI